MNTTQINKLYKYFKDKDKQINEIKEIKNFLSLIGKTGHSQGKITSFCRADLEIHYQRNPRDNNYHKCAEANELLREVLIEEQNYLFDKFKLKLQKKEKEITEGVEQDIENIVKDKVR